MTTYYSKDHEWIRLEKDSCLVGITAYAAEQLGDITYVELPEVGSEFEQGDVLCEVESVKAASEVFAPIAGKVLETNQALFDSPEILNGSPEDAGWIARLEPKFPGKVEGLFDQAGYRAYLDSLR